MTAANDSAGDVHFELTAAYTAHNEPAPEPLTELNTLLLKSQQNDCFTDAHADKVRVNWQGPNSSSTESKTGVRANLI